MILPAKPERIGISIKQRNYDHLLHHDQDLSEQQSGQVSFRSLLKFLCLFLLNENKKSFWESYGIRCTLYYAITGYNREKVL